MRSDKFGSQLDSKSKTWFFTFLNVYISWIEQEKILITQLSPPKLDILQTRMDKKGNPIKMNSDNFQIQKWISQIVRVQKIDEKSGVICLVSFFPSWVMALKLHKIVLF